MKRIIINIIAIFLTASLFAATRTAEEAAIIAAQFTNKQTNTFRAPRAAGELRLVHRTNKPQSDEAALYVFNQPDNSGFVMVSADDNAVTILGYSDEGAFDNTNIPSNVQFWLDYYAERIATAQPSAHAQEGVQRTTTQETVVQPLLGGIKWDQTSPYNKLCPIVQGSRCPTGCVATAAAQIMKFYEWPEQGQGSRSYKDDGETRSADFGNTTYDWDNMLDKYTSGYTTAEANAVATLMYHVGVSCKMDYEPNGSGALTDNMRDGLVNYFRYKNTAQYIRYKTTAELTALFKTELAANRPILLGGADSDGYDAEGHEFVCDGIDANGLFHINWGWSGTSNGYFALSSLDPDEEGTGAASSGAGYSHDIDCVIGIEPDRDPVNVTGVTLDSSSATIKIKERYPLTYTISPSNASNKAVSWISSNEAVAKVTEDGAVVGVSVGSATITVKTNDGSYTATCQVTVTNEVALPTALVVDYGYAEYNESQGGWIILLYDSEKEVPWVQFYTDRTGENKIAGTYNIQGDAVYLWNDPADQEAYITSTEGQMIVTCVGKDDGTNGCNTYSIDLTFTGNDDVEYALQKTLELCAVEEDGETAIDLEDDTTGSVDPIDPIDPIVTGDDFVLLTNINQLAAGDEVILVSTANNVAAATIENDVFTTEAVTISNNTISIPSTSNVVVMTVNKSGSNWTFTNNGQLLKATAVKKVTFGANTGNANWTISISNGDATIQSTTDSYGRFLYNVNSPRFTTYTSNTSASMLLPQLYVRKETTTGVEDTKVLPKAQKILENGQIILLVDGKKYTVLGQKIQ